MSIESCAANDSAEPCCCSELVVAPVIAASAINCSVKLAEIRQVCPEPGRAGTVHLVRDIRQPVGLKLTSEHLWAIPASAEPSHPVKRQRRTAEQSSTSPVAVASPPATKAKSNSDDGQ